MNKFWDNFADWIKPRTLFAAGLYFTVYYMLINQIVIPELLKSGYLLLLGFYFGQHVKRKEK